MILVVHPNIWGKNGNKLIKLFWQTVIKVPLLTLMYKINVCLPPKEEHYKRKENVREFHGTPAVRSPPFHCDLTGSVLGCGAQIPQVRWRRLKRKRKSKLK